jgi:hypothetical protein
MLNDLHLTLFFATKFTVYKLFGKIKPKKSFTFAAETNEFLVHKGLLG